MAENALDPPAGPMAGGYRLLLPGFAVEVTTGDGSVVFRSDGELDLANAPRLVRALGTLDTGPTSTVDLSGLAFVGQPASVCS